MGNFKDSLFATIEKSGVPVRQFAYTTGSETSISLIFSGTQLVFNVRKRGPDEYVYSKTGRDGLLALTGEERTHLSLDMIGTRLADWIAFELLNTSSEVP